MWPDSSMILLDQCVTDVLMLSVARPLGLVPKINELGLDLPELYPDEELLYRLIMDLKRSGVNSHIPKENTKVQYAKFDQAIAMCLEHRKGCYIAKLDIKSAFRNIPIHPSDCHLLGVQVPEWSLHGQMFTFWTVIIVHDF